MQRRSKQKSCFPCVSGKRKCDRTFPSCTRCIDRGVDCAYPLSTARQTQNGPNAALNSSSDLILSPACEPQAQDEFTVSDFPLQLHSSQNVFNFESSVPPGHGVTSAGCLIESTVSLAPTSSITTSPAELPQLPTNLRWFTHPSTWKIAYHFQPPEVLPPPQVFSDFVRGLHAWLIQFQRGCHNPFIHHQLYPPRSVPACIQDAYAAIAVSQGGNAENEHMVDLITSSYAAKLVSQQASLADQTLHAMTIKDHLARTQALLIYFLLALSSSSLSRQTKAERYVETLHHWKNEMLAFGEQEARLAQLFPCSLTTQTESSGPDLDPILDLHRAFITCESIRRTWLLCSLATGVYRSLKGDWAAACGGDICFTARAGLWDAASSAHWAEIACKTDPLFDFSLCGEALAKRGVPALEVDEFARHLFTLMWGTDKVKNWLHRTQNTELLGV